jgi:hypothetical protein
MGLKRGWFGVEKSAIEICDVIFGIMSIFPRHDHKVCCYEKDLHSHTHEHVYSE